MNGITSKYDTKFMRRPYQFFSTLHLCTEWIRGESTILCPKNFDQSIHSLLQPVTFKMMRPRLIKTGKKEDETIRMRMILPAFPINGEKKKRKGLVFIYSPAPTICVSVTFTLICSELMCCSAAEKSGLVAAIILNFAIAKWCLNFCKA